MKGHQRMKTLGIAVLFIFGVFYGTAAGASLDQYLNSSLGSLGKIGANSSGLDVMSGGDSPSTSSSRSYGSSMGKVHKYLGYGTIAAGAAAAVSGSDNGFHKGAGNAAAVLAVATCISGFMEYSDYFDMDEGLSMHNIHIVVGTLATAGFVATAVDANSNDDDGHAGLGIGSGVLMVVPIVVLHF